MHTLDEVVDWTLQRFLGAIGEFQSSYFALIRDQKEVNLLLRDHAYACSIHLPSGLMSTDFELLKENREYGQHGPSGNKFPGTFFMSRHKVEITTAPYQREFLHHLARRYGPESTYVLLGVGFDVNDKRARDEKEHYLFEHRSHCETSFSLFGGKAETEYLFQQAQESANDLFFPIIQGVCRKTPHLIDFGLMSYKPSTSDDGQHYQHPRYVLFTEVQRVFLIDRPTGRRYEAEIKK